MSEKTSLIAYLKLNLNIQHPNLEECYVFGYEFAIANFGEDENPYQTGTKESDHWLEGWWAGFYGEEPLFTLDCKEDNKSIGSLDPKEAANDSHFHHIFNHYFIVSLLKITGAIAATALVGYQLIDLVA